MTEAQDSVPSGYGRLPFRPTLRMCILGVVLIAVLPTIGTVMVAVWHAGRAHQEASLRQLLETARTVAQSAASEVETRSKLLEAYASALPPLALAPGERHVPLEQFFDGELTIVRLPEQGAPAPDLLNAALLPDVRQALATRRPVVSNLIETTVADSPVLRLATVAAVPGTSQAVAVLMSAPQEMVRALARDEAPAGMVLAVTDGNGRIIARSREIERFLGRRVPDWARLQSIEGHGSSFQARLLDGPEVIFAFERLSGLPGWVAVVGEPYDIYAARWRDPVIVMAAASALTIVLALLLAGFLTRRILRPITALARHSRSIVEADGREGMAAVDVPASFVEEFETLRVNLANAEEALLRRAEAERSVAAALAHSERRYRAIAETGALAFWRLDASGQLTAAPGADTMTGRALESLLGTGWQDAVHPDDLPLAETATAQALETGGRIDVEFRLVMPEGGWRWVRARGAPIPTQEGSQLEWAGVLEDVDERRRAQARVAHIAHHDGLTGLPNRILFRERLDAAVHLARRGEPGAVLYLDLDRFKEVNDTLGHPVGDLLLKEVTARLKLVVRETDTVARLGGDEFAVVMTGVEQPAAALSLAARLVEVIPEPYLLEGHSVTIGVSIGVDIVAGADADADHVLKNADIALYRAKEEGRGQYRFFEPDMDERMRERRALEVDLRHSFDAGHFHLHYQPIIALEPRRLVGFEAMLRWEHPERGVVLPAGFLPLAEEIGLLVPLGARVLHQACCEAAGWPAALKVAVNLSPVEVLTGNLPLTISNALAHSGLDPARLEIEMAEVTMIRDSATALRVLHAIKELGVGVSMDNFGSGYSSLGYLRSFPFDKVKIDRSFVGALGQGVEGEAVVRAITALCGSLGIVTTADGVETEAQVNILRAEQCTQAQGFLFSAAMPAADLPEFWGRFSAEV